MRLLPAFLRWNKRMRATVATSLNQFIERSRLYRTYKTQG